MKKVFLLILTLIAFWGYLWAIVRVLAIMRIAQRVGFGGMLYGNFVEQTPISILVIIIMLMLVLMATKTINKRNFVRVPLLIGVYFFSIEFSQWLAFVLLGLLT